MPRKAPIAHEDAGFIPRFTAEEGEMIMKRTCFSLVASVTLAALLYGPSPALAQTAP